MRNEKGQWVKGNESCRKGTKCSEETIIKMKNSQKNKEISEKEKERLKEIGYKKGHGKGNDNINWIEDKSLLKEKLDKQIRKSFKYRQWRSDIFERDNYTCQKCNAKGGEINADHIKAFSIILKENNIKTLEDALICEELWNINNGRTLCEKCHKKTENYGIVLVRQMKNLNLN